MKFTTSFIVTLCLVYSFNAIAQNWTGNVNSDWNNPANWSYPPSGNSILIIDPINYTGNAVQPIISSISNFIPSELTIQNDADLIMYSQLTVIGNLKINGSGSTMKIESGALQIKGNGNLSVDLGGELIQNNGFVSINQNLLIANGQANNSSSYIMDGGNLVVNNSLSFESEIDDFSPSFNMVGGTLTVNNDITWFGQAPGIGRPEFIISGGTVNANGDIKNLPGSTVDMYLKLKQSSILNMNGSLLETINVADSIIQENTSQLFFNASSVFNNSGVFYAKSGVVKFNSNTTLQGNGMYQFHDITITALSSLNHISPQDIFVSGNLYTSGTFTHNLNTLNINGTIQTWNGDTGSGVVLNNLTINQISSTNNFSVMNFSNSVIVEGHLELIKGFVYTSFGFNQPDNLLILTDGATSSLGSSQSFVDGPMRKIGDDAFIFPIGTDNHLGRLEISAPSDINSEFTAFYANGTFNNITDFTAPLSAVSNSECWSLTRENSADLVDVKLYWEDAAYSHLLDCNELSIASWDGNSWTHQSATVTGSCTGNGAGTITTDNLQNDFNFFTFGYLGNVTTENITICNGATHIIGTDVYDTSGIYTHVYPASSGGDSTVITNLTVLPPNENTYFADLCFGETIYWQGNFYDEEGIYTESFTSYLGCDSTLHLVVFVADEINTQVTQNGGTLSAQNTTADHYQWVDCDSGIDMEYANYPTFTPSQNGSYALRIRENNSEFALRAYCEATSACFTINSVGLDDLDDEDDFSIYPNPSTGIFYLNWKTETPVETIEVYDLKGKMIWSQNEFQGKKLSIDLKNRDAGIYFLKVNTDRVSTYKMVKK